MQDQPNKGNVFCCLKLEDEFSAIRKQSYSPDWLLKLKTLTEGLEAAWSSIPVRRVMKGVLFMPPGLK